MIFQDPLSALTPVYTVGDQIAEAVLVHNDVTRQAAHARAVELLALAGIPNAARRASAFPHEFSGGMRQRVMIAMAIANQPDLIIADEPTTALDVTIQAQILDVLRTAKEATGAAVILITHDLGVVAGFADRVAVMYAGTHRRRSATWTMCSTGRGCRTRSDCSARSRDSTSDADSRSRRSREARRRWCICRPGCPFWPRCPLRIEKCLEVEPALLPIARARPVAPGRLPPQRRDRTAADDEHRYLPRAAAAVRGRRCGARDSAQPVLEVRDLVKHYPLLKGGMLRRRVGTVHAVDGISFDIRERETLGLVGESGCGKTTAIMEILNLVRPQAGTIVVLGRDTATLTPAERFAIRRDLQVVFQDPMASLDPRLPIGDILAEPLETHGVPAADRARRVRELLTLVGLQPEHANRYPQAFSGGQRQRIGIARALALEPKVLVLDEPVSALDVSIRAGVINLLEELQAALGLSYLFVAHDLSVVRHIADRVAVMYLGRIAEIGGVDEVFDRPAHPYTQALLSAIPLPDPKKERQRRRIVLQGDLPNPADPPSGCRFRTRCQKFAGELTDEQRTLCIEQQPPLLPRTGAPDHLDALPLRARRFGLVKNGLLCVEAASGTSALEAFMNHCCRISGSLLVALLSDAWNACLRRWRT